MLNFFRSIQGTSPRPRCSIQTVMTLPLISVQSCRNFQSWPSSRTEKSTLSIALSESVTEKIKSIKIIIILSLFMLRIHMLYRLTFFLCKK